MSKKYRSFISKKKNIIVEFIHAFIRHLESWMMASSSRQTIESTIDRSRQSSATAPEILENRARGERVSIRRVVRVGIHGDRSNLGQQKQSDPDSGDEYDGGHQEAEGGAGVGFGLLLVGHFQFSLRLDSD